MYLIISLAEALGRLKGTKAKGWIVTLFDSPMTLLNWIAQAGDHLMLHFSSQLFFNSPEIRAGSIGENLFGGNTGNVLSLLKEGFRRRHIWANAREDTVGEIFVNVQNTYFAVDRATELQDVLIANNAILGLSTY